ELPTDTGLQAFVTEQQQKLERRLITRALEQCGGNQTKAAKLLKLPLRTLVHKLKALDLR
ncbi:MAG: helix-turn-helix domain-containing protein, partial [Archangium sp.]|nr:helix-turn-helix domain-containing protein [Archangium sp.]